MFNKFSFWSASANCAETIAAATRSHLFRIPYALFTCESGFYQFVDQNHVDASSEDTTEILDAAARAQTGGFSQYNAGAEYHVAVYEVR